MVACCVAARRMRKGFARRGGAERAGSRSAKRRAVALPSIAQEAEPVAHMVATVAPIVAGEAVSDKAVGRQLHTKASVFRPMSRSGREHLAAGHFAAKGAGDCAKVIRHRCRSSPRLRGTPG